jgi:hypothetical protein
VQGSRVDLVKFVELNGLDGLVEVVQMDGYRVGSLHFIDLDVGSSHIL